MKAIVLFLSAAVLAFSSQMQVEACSNVILDQTRTLNNDVVSARTLDFPDISGTTLVKVPRGRWFFSNDSSLQRVTRPWKGIYGFVGMDFFDARISNQFKRRIFVDGLNEVGLSAAWLWLDESAFPLRPAGDPKALVYGDLVTWIVSQYSSVAEVTEALLAVQDHITTSELLRDFDLTFPLHLVVHDATGKSLVAQWHFDVIGAEPVMHLYSGDEVDHVGVLTNSPIYPDQLAELAQYAHITNENGLEGLAGGLDSVSRFVRLAKLREFLDFPLGGESDRVGAVAQALHAINHVDVGYGVEMDDTPVAQYNETSLTVVRDHSNLVLYFKGLHNQSLRSIDLKTLNFNLKAGKEAAIRADISPIEHPNWTARYVMAEDVTAQLSAPESRYYFRRQADAGQTDLPDPNSDEQTDLLDLTPTIDVAAEELGEAEKRYLFNLNLTIDVALEDRGKPGMFFIYGMDLNGRYWNWLGSRVGWRMTQPTTLSPFRVGKLQTAKVDGVFFETEAKHWDGFRVFAGYGKTLTEMLLTGKAKQVFMVEGTRQ